MCKHWQRLSGNEAWNEHARTIAEIPPSQLPRGRQRDQLISLARTGQVEAYTPIGSDRYTLWFEQPKRERMTLADWLFLTSMTR